MGVEAVQVKPQPVNLGYGLQDIAAMMNIQQQVGVLNGGVEYEPEF